MLPRSGGRRDRPRGHGTQRLRDDGQVQAVRLRALQDPDEDVGEVPREIVDLRGVVPEELARRVLSLHAGNALAVEGWPGEGDVRRGCERYSLVDRPLAVLERNAEEGVQREGHRTVRRSREQIATIDKTQERIMPRRPLGEQHLVQI